MNAENITDARPQASGVLYIAPKGTTAPTDASTALANTFKQIGYAAKDDGLTITANRETQQWDAWEADDVVRVLDSHSVEVKFKLMEPFDENAAKMLFGAANVTVSSGVVTKISINSDELEEHVLVAEMLCRDGRKMRAVVPRFNIDQEGDIVFKRGEPVSPEVTGAALAPATGGKVTLHFATPTPGGSA